MKKICLISICLSFFSVTLNAQEAFTNLQDLLLKIKEAYAPDLRVAIFEVAPTDSEGIVTIKGKTNLPIVQKAIQRLCDTNGCRNEVTLLPTADIGDANYGIVNISTAFVRAAPHYELELVTQTLLGTPIKVWEKKGTWFRIQTPDGYLGWLTETSFKRQNKRKQQEWLAKEKVIFTDFYGQTLTHPNKKSIPVSDIVAGCLLNKTRKVGSFYQVTYPDGRTAYIHSSQCRLLATWIKTLPNKNIDIVNTAERFLGLPYLWGGTTTKAVDCSGLVKMVYYLHNIILPRDASQQVKEGQKVEFSPTYKELQLGDLLFFGPNEQRITHVGIYIGDKQFIHSSGTVHITSLDPLSPLYVERYVTRLQTVRRIVGHTTKGISSLTTNSFYTLQ